MKSIVLQEREIFTLIPPEIEPGDLFQAIETVIPQEAILEAMPPAPQAGR